MSQQANDKRIDYIEFPALDVARMRQFYETVFGWKFEDYGPDYTSFADGRIAGGFYKAPATGQGPGALVVIYAADLAAMEARVTEAGGRIVEAGVFVSGADAASTSKTPAATNWPSGRSSYDACCGGSGPFSRRLALTKSISVCFGIPGSKQRRQRAS